MTLLLALFGVGATAGNLLGGRLADHSLRGTLFGGLVSLATVLVSFPLLMRTELTAALAVILLGTAAFLGLAVASVAYAVDRRRAPQAGRERVVATYVPQRSESLYH